MPYGLLIGPDRVYSPENWSCLVKSYLNLALCMSLSLSTQAFAQTASAPIDEHTQASPGSSPAAYVYVSSTVSGGGTHEIKAFAAAPNGKLTSVPGSPFQENVTDMAVNGKYLFAVSGNGIDFETYRIEPNGALHYTTTDNFSQSVDCDHLGPLFLDHTGASLYDLESNASGCANNTYESLAIEKPTGELKDMGNSSANNWLSVPASFIGNNVYAYSASCIADLYWGIFGFERGSDGLLTQIPINAKPPTPPAGYFYCPSLAAADPTDHVAISMQLVNDETFVPEGPARLATYTADAKGLLSSASTVGNMPETSVASVKDINMSPSGKLLAVGGTGGLQIFHFNGSDPIKSYTGLLTKDEIDQFFWDNQNHLYAISRTANKLFVFTITPTSYSEAPGSPYSVNQPQNIIVQPER
jgi:hypothetical protein